MNIRKNIDYSAMFAAMDTAMATGMSQMELYCQLGALVCERPEKGAAVAAAEYLKNRYQDASGFSPRNLRRMRDFYRIYGGQPELLKLAMEVSWTHNVVILEAELNLEERRWYLCAAQQFGWSKADLQKKIAAEAHLELLLDESEVPCYTECEDSKLECSKHDQDTFPLPWEHLQKPDGRVHYERSGEEGQSGAEHSDRVAATSTEEIGNPVYPPARRKLSEHGIDCSGKRARQLLNSDYEKYDLLIGMDHANMRSMYRICGGDFADKMHLLMDFTNRPGEVADPWYTGDFDTTWRDVEEGCQGLLQKIINKEV